MTKEEIIGRITLENQFDSTRTQNKSWEQQIHILKGALQDYQGTVFFEFSIPRMGKRVDAIVVIDNVVFVIEFKVGEDKFHNHHVEQVWDYALDLKNFHKTSHNVVLVPVLIATEAVNSLIETRTTSHNDKLLLPIRIGKKDLSETIKLALQFFAQDSDKIDEQAYANGNYSPTPTIIEAAISLYNNHSVEQITRSDADAINLTSTTSAISQIITSSKENNRKSIVSLLACQVQVKL
jgi:hypothetical protein